jgi:hypothetical protein
MKRTTVDQTDGINVRALANGWFKHPVLLLAAFVILIGSAHASDPIGVFGKIDKAVLSPSEDAPETIQLWGSFCLADKKDRDSYQAPQKGYMLFKVPSEKAEVARKEWKDLKAVAGTGEIIGFGSRYALNATVRKANDKPEKPEAYPVGFGLVKANQRSSSYGPIKALQGE